MPANRSPLIDPAAPLRVVQPYGPAELLAESLHEAQRQEQIKRGIPESEAHLRWLHLPPGYRIDTIKAFQRLIDQGVIELSPSCSS